jgi:hypothetical protein
VIIRGKEELAGYWRGIHMETNSINNDLDYLELYDAGSNYVYCCNTLASLFFKDGRCAISNLTIGRAAGYGIYADDDFEFTGFTNVTIDAEKEPMSIAAERVDEIEANSNLSGGPGFNYILIQNTNITTPVTFRKQSVPYRVSSVLDITEAMTVEAGVQFAFDENAGLGVYDNGSLPINGTASQKVILTGVQQVKGYWRGIHTETNTLANDITHAEITYAGSNYVYCCNSIAALFVKAGTMTITDSYIADNDGCGIFTGASATLTESGNTFANNTDGNICN